MWLLHGKHLNRWKTAADELKDFKIDPRFEVNLFAGEEEFPDIAAPIQNILCDRKEVLFILIRFGYFRKLNLFLASIQRKL